MKPTIIPLQSPSSETKLHVGSLLKRFFQPRFIKLIIAMIAIVNIFYISLYFIDENSSNTIKNKLKTHASLVMDNFYNQEDFEVNGSGNKVSSHSPITIDSTTTAPKQKDIHDDLPIKESDDDIKNRLYSIPDKPFTELSDSDKILHRLNEITLGKDRFWLAHTELTDIELGIKIKDFLKENWVSNPTLFYDPRFTLSIYINEIKNQYLKKNPKNEKDKLHEIVVPFAWSDWVDLTMLNEEFTKEERDRKNCEYLKLTHHVPAQNPNYCVNLQDLTDDDLREMGLPATDFIPGFAIKESPTNKASNEVRMLEGKAHLLTYAKNPFKVIFLSKSGVYEAQIEGKQRLVDSDLFNRFLVSKNIQNFDTRIVLNPVQEFEEFMANVKPNPVDLEDDVYGMVEKIKDKDTTKSKEIYLPESVFNYQQDKIDEQLAEFDRKLEILHHLTTNELIFNEKGIQDNRMSRNEYNYFKSLKYLNTFEPDKEQTYFRMARLNFDKNDKNHDAGWHYEWRFFNGAMRYLKKGWNREELLIRDKILLDRILRNWFRFANEKGIISWIAHGPLLSWYWDGLLFPFDEDIDIQMPAHELTRLSKSYNQTLVIEDVTEGFGKFFIDCSTFLHHRGKTNKQNHIDARFIDIDTGSYIDITGLGISDDEAPERYNDIISAAERDGRPKPVYNCRNSHFTSYDEISPLRFTMMGGVPLYVPNQIQTILNDEYHDGMRAYVYNGYYFVDSMNLWIHGSNLTFLFEEDPMIKQDFKDSDGNLIEDRFTELVKSMDDSKVLKLIENNEDLLLEYYLTKNVTDLHKEELTYMFDLPQGQKTLLGDVGDQFDGGRISNNGDYHKFVAENFKFQKPFRRPLFNYEYIDRPKHHKEYVSGSN